MVSVVAERVAGEGCPSAGGGNAKGQSDSIPCAFRALWVERRQQGSRQRLPVGNRVRRVAAIWP